MVYQLVLEKMMEKNKILVNINNLNEIEEYKKIGITNFLFPVRDYSIGYNSFELVDIPDGSYLYMNRILDTKDISSIKAHISDFKRFRGIFYEDMGIYNIFKDTSLELICASLHFTTNYESVNTLLDLKLESVLISNDITIEEVKSILLKSKKDLVLTVLGRNPAMYSRRTLLTNYNKYNNLPLVKEATLDEIHTNNKFIAQESEYGTILFNKEYFNIIKYVNDLSNIKYYLILNHELNVNEIDEIINGKEFGNDGFANIKTVYRLNDYKGDKV